MLRLFTLLTVAVAFIYAIESDRKSFASDSIGKMCKPVNCGGKIKNCPYGYEKHDGCEICKCRDPCNPSGKAILCGANQRCYVNKKSDGTFVGSCGLQRMTRSAGICRQKTDVGKCRANQQRFYYDSTTHKCEPFTYSGCGGNGNNFKTKEQCQKICAH